ncbi:hypothetical protein B0H14DRAFT_2584430 [Mycena olivaceomarginata]|nr:hypothetical protein B0H14DRAFT_2584430 [Mycena olivaceomarginata]
MYLIKCIRKLVTNKFLPARSSTSPLPTINDAMVEMALQPSEPREQGALAWTFNSLTELLPFLEVLPEAIHHDGVKGFHLANDYLFIPLLNEQSLGRCITDFILGCRNMDLEDPRRLRGIIAGMKTIWALCMIAGRPADHGGDFWFHPSTRHAVRNPDGVEGYEKTVENGWSHYLADACSWAMVYSRVNNIRSCIVSASRIAERTMDHDTVVAAVKTVLAMFRHLGVVDIPEDLRSNRDTLEAFCDGTATKHNSEVEMHLSLMARNPTWQAINVRIVCQILLQAASVVSMGGQPPYEYLQTCHKLVPQITAPDNDQVMARPQTFSPWVAEYFNPSCLNPHLRCLEITLWICYIAWSPLTAITSKLNVVPMGLPYL